MNNMSELIRSDAFRSLGRSRLRDCLGLALRSSVFRYQIFLRLCAGLKERRFCYPLFLMARALRSWYEMKHGIHIPTDCRIGPGFYIGHGMGIVINPQVVIGRNFNISQGVTIGESNRGPRKGAAIIGNNVYVGPGAKIIGKVRIGNYAVIGANAVVTKDVPENGVVGGVPAQLISLVGSREYIQNAV